MEAAVTGIRLREALKRWRIKRDVADKQFTDSLWAFEEDQKATPQEVAKNFTEADMMIAKLQDVQAEYNRRVMVKVEGAEISLSAAIRLVGGAGRLESMWRRAATETGLGRYSDRELSRPADEIRAKRVVSQANATIFSDNAARYAAALRTAIATGNATRLSMEVPDGVLN